VTQEEIIKAIEEALAFLEATDIRSGEVHDGLVRALAALRLAEEERQLSIS
jgi:hypothetical protein